MLEIVKPLAETRESSCAVSIIQLTLSNFRNYSHLRLEIDAQPVVLTGNNGAGKTNILEAISFLSPGRGLRRAALREVDCANTQAPWAVSANMLSMRGETSLGTGRDGESTADRRAVKVNGKQTRQQAELAKAISILWLTPQMDQLFNEGMSARRKFLDRLAYGFDAEHATYVSAYEQAMRERNRLLQEGYGENAWFAALEQKMAETAVAIAAGRLHTVERLNAAMLSAESSFPQAHMQVHGWVEDKLREGCSALQAEAELIHALAGARSEDRMAGRTSLGTHKSEVKVHYLLKNIEVEQCSTGEQKALLLSIILGQARAAAQWRGQPPVLLLDETVAHLDAGRRQALFEEIDALRLQAWMTGTDASLFTGIRHKAQFFRVENASLV